MTDYAYWLIGFVMGNLCCYLMLARPALRKWTEAKEQYWAELERRK